MDFLDFVVVGLLMVAPVVLANILAKRGRPAEIILFHILSFLLNLGLLFTGLLFAIIPADLMAEFQATSAGDVPDLRPSGLIIMAAALWGTLVSLSPFRRRLARLIPITPTSPVHTLALVLAGYLVIQGALALAPGGLEQVADNSTPVSVGFLALSEGVFAVVAAIGVGYPLRRRGREVLDRLGLQWPTLAEWILAAVVTAGVVLAWFIFATIWALTSPQQVEQLDQINGVLLQEIDSFWDWLILAIAAGVGEEILFRGALQPVFGLFLSSILFAALHVQFGFTPAFFFIFLLSLVLGLVRRRTNTTVVILIHFGYDFAQGLLFLLGQWAEQFA